MTPAVVEPLRLMIIMITDGDDDNLNLNDSAVPASGASVPVSAWPGTTRRTRWPSGTLGHCYIALFFAVYHLGYIAPAKLPYSKGAISIFCYIATFYIAIM